MRILVFLVCWQRWVKSWNVWNLALTVAAEGNRLLLAELRIMRVKVVTSAGRYGAGLDLGCTGV